MIFLDIFSTGFWLSLLAVVFLVYLAFDFTSRLVPESYPRSTCLLMTVQIAVNQSQIDVDFGSRPGRMLFVSASMMGIVVYTAFSAELTSRLTVEKVRIWQDISVTCELSDSTYNRPL